MKLAVDNWLWRWIVKIVWMRTELMDCYINLEAFEELEAGGGI